jgi:hypothetical protein
LVEMIDDAGSGLLAAKLTGRKRRVRVDLVDVAMGDGQAAWMTGPKKLAQGHGAETARPWLRRQAKQDRGFNDNKARFKKLKNHDAKE